MRHKKDVNCLVVLLCCLKDDDYSKITVKELSKMSKISRNAFYEKFKSKQNFIGLIIRSILKNRVNLESDNQNKIIDFIDLITKLKNRYELIFKKYSIILNNIDLIDIIEDEIYKYLNLKTTNNSLNRFIKKLIEYILETLLYYSSNNLKFNNEIKFIKHIVVLLKI